MYGMSSLTSQQIIALRNVVRQALDIDYSGITSAQRMAMAIRFTNAIGGEWNAPFTVEAVRASPIYPAVVSTSSTAQPMVYGGTSSFSGLLTKKNLLIAAAVVAGLYFFRKGR